MIADSKTILFIFLLSSLIRGQEGSCLSADQSSCVQADAPSYATCVWCVKTSSCFLLSCQSNFSDVQEQCTRVSFNSENCVYQKDEFDDLWIVVYLYAVVSSILCMMVVSKVVVADYRRCAQILMLSTIFIMIILLTVTTFQAFEIWIGALIATIPIMLCTFMSILMICSTVVGPDMMVWPIIQLVLLCLGLGFLFSVSEPDRLSAQYQHLWVTVLAITFGYFACCLLFSARVVRAKAQDAQLAVVRPPFPFHLKTIGASLTTLVWIFFLGLAVISQEHRKSCSAAYVTFVTAFVTKFMYDDMNAMSKLWVATVVLTLVEAFTSIVTFILEGDQSIDDTQEDIPSLLSSSIALVVLCILVWHILRHRDGLIYIDLARERAKQITSTFIGSDSSELIGPYVD